jgi:hypothetical protein
LVWAGGLIARGAVGASAEDPGADAKGMLGFECAAVDGSPNHPDSHASLSAVVMQRGLELLREETEPRPPRRLLFGYS